MGESAKGRIANAKSVQEAADSIGVSYNTFKSWCRKFGLLPEGDNPKGVLKKIKEKLTGTVNGLAGMPSSSLSPESGSSNDKQGMVEWPKGFRYSDGNAPVAPFSTLSRGGGLRREYSSVEYVKERNAAISASMESGPLGCYSSRNTL